MFRGQAVSPSESQFKPFYGLQPIRVLWLVRAYGNTEIQHERTVHRTSLPSVCLLYPNVRDFSPSSPLAMRGVSQGDVGQGWWLGGYVALGALDGGVRIHS